MKRYDVAPGGSTTDMVPADDGAWVLFEDVERIALLTAKMRADLAEVGGFERRFLGVPALNLREYIVELEAALAVVAGPNVAIKRAR